MYDREYPDNWRGTIALRRFVSYERRMHLALMAIVQERMQTVYDRFADLGVRIDTHAVQYVDIADELGELQVKFEEFATDEVAFPCYATDEAVQELMARLSDLHNEYIGLLSLADPVAAEAGVFQEYYWELSVCANRCREEWLAVTARRMKIMSPFMIAYEAMWMGNPAEAVDVLNKGMALMPAIR